MTPNWKCLGIASIKYNIKPLKWDAQIRVAFSLIKCQISGIIFVEMNMDGSHTSSLAHNSSRYVQTFQYKSHPCKVRYNLRGVRCKKPSSSNIHANTRT
ncbi:hypothetical protein L2E82_42227 [Cichorium intybus]|uniref:Uncharacterized protein n=1 Tax=Cichorium intybus TaxID=13427 RepID=A0ACB8ZM01_CICIN|nr:hypothetical protein L2E82_42227 [Cichorium intybus]